MREATSGTRKKLPPDWRWVRLGDVCDLNPRRPSFDRADNAPTTFVPMPAVDDRDGIIAKPETRFYGEVKRGYTYFAEGDVLFAKITPCMQNGKHAIAQGLIDGIGFGSTEFHVIRPGSDICSAWIHSFIRQPQVLHDATVHFTGAVGQQRVPHGYLADLEIPLPPFAEQKRIAAVLNELMAAAERARAAAQSQLDAAEVLPSAYLRQAFPRPGQKLPSGWRWLKLGEVSSIHPGQHIMEADYNYDHVGIGYLTGPADFGLSTAIVSKWTEKPKAFAQPGDVLVTVKGAGVGKSNRAPTEKVAIGRQLMAVRAARGLSDSEFLYLFVSTQLSTLSSRALGATVPGLGRKDVESLMLALPPLAEQKRIVVALNQKMVEAEKLLAGLAAQLDQINALPASLLRRAFAGEL